jgi:hypothetical protein
VAFYKPDRRRERQEVSRRSAIERVARRLRVFVDVNGVKHRGALAGANVREVVGLLVRLLVSSLTVAKLDSMTLVVRTSIQCSARKSKWASKASRSFSTLSMAFGYLPP